MQVLLLALLLAHTAARVNCVPVLVVDPLLTHVARVKAAELQRCPFAHAACGLPWDHGYPPYRARIAENLAVGYLHPAAVMLSWMASPEHRATILDCRYLRVGFAHAGLFWVVEFSS